MIHVEGHKFTRDGEQIGWLEGSQLYDKDGRHVGYFEEENIYNRGGHKLAYIRGDYLHAENDEKIELSKLRESVHGGELSDLARGAVQVLLGD